MQDLSYESIFSFRGRAYNDAMAAHPLARENERAALIRLFDLGPSDHFADAPAGGGYLADGIIETFGRELSVTCIEPAAEFGEVIDPAFTTLNSSVTDLPLPDGAITALGSLAGLHHIAGRGPIFAEWARVLAPGGQLAVADVAIGSPTSDFLNGFVDQHTPQGHDGIFIEPGEFSRHMEANGIKPLSDEIISVPWIFTSREAVGEFCKKLFFLESASAEDVTEAIDEALGIHYQAEFDRWLMNWELVYAFGRKRS